jgi:shikimate kinase
MKKIFLLGYMGCGKSTIAKLLANLTSISYLDLDEIIEKQENSSVKKLFSDKGEIYFRKLERQILASLIHNQDSFVLSLGGGTPCYSNNHEFLNADHVISIYLNASVDTLYERLLFYSEQRPLIADKNPEEMKEFIAKNLFDRSYYYNQAKYKITVEGKSPEEILSEIENLLA